MTPQTNIFSSSDEAVIPSLPSYTDDFKQFQELMKQIADSLQTLSEEMQASKLGHPPQTPSGHVALPVNEALLNPAKTSWNLTDAPSDIQVDKKYYVPAKN